MTTDPYVRGRQRSPLANEQPFVPTITFRDIPSMEAALGLPLAKPAVREMRAAILAALLRAHRCGCSALHFSRDRTHYATCKSRYVPRSYSYLSVTRAIEQLFELDLVTEIRTRPGSTSKFRSRLSLPLGCGWLDADWAILAEEVCELVHLKDADKNYVDYRDTPMTIGMRRDIVEHNEFLSGLHVEARSPNFPPLNGLLPPNEEGHRAVVGNHYYRVFNKDWRYGGRWYGPWWQNVKKDIRATIHIDGEPCQEEDYRSFHPQLVCAACNIDLPFGDAGFDFYVIDRVFPRSHYKLAVNILLNASPRSSAHSALCKALREQHGLRTPGGHARDLIERIERAYPQLTPYWGLGVSRRLQNFDGDMLSRIQMRLRRAAIPHLSVHDSIVAPNRWFCAVKQVMEEELDRLRHTLQRLGPNALF